MSAFMEFNVNYPVHIKLRPEGVEAAKAHWKAYGLDWIEPEKDADGFSQWQMWEVMKIFGPSISLGRPMPFETSIRIPTKLLHPKERDHD